MTAKIYQQMAKIMAEVAPIAKGQRNQQQGYNFRGIDDVYEALHHIMARHGVFSLPTVLHDRTEDRVTAKGSALIYRVLTIKYTFYAEDGSSVEAVVIGEGMDSGDKASNKAMSVAEKYCLLQAFKIPTREAKDPENDSHDLKPKQATKAALPPSGSPMLSASGKVLKFTRADIVKLLEEVEGNDGSPIPVVYDPSIAAHKRLFGMACMLVDITEPEVMRKLSDLVAQKQVAVGDLKSELDYQVKVGS